MILEVVVQWSQTKVSKTGVMWSHGEISRNRNSECGTLIARRSCIDRTVQNLCYSFLFVCARNGTTIKLEWLHCTILCSRSVFFWILFNMDRWSGFKSKWSKLPCLEHVSLTWNEFLSWFHTQLRLIFQFVFDVCVLSWSRCSFVHNFESLSQFAVSY